MKLLHLAFRSFDRGVQRFNRRFDRALNHAVRPRPKLNNGRSFLYLAAGELLTGPRRRRSRGRG
jgi:hypothetical protein